MHLKVVLDASGSLALSTSAGQTQSHKHLTDNLRQPPFKNPTVTGGSLLSVGGIALTVCWMQVFPTTISLKQMRPDSKKAEQYEKVNTNGN